MITSTPTGNNTSGTLVSDAAVTTFSPFTIGSKIFGNLLPVDLLSFEAELINGQVELTWTTASELNNDYFLVQRSSDALNWEDVTQVNGNGTTSQYNSYQATDSQPLSGKFYYRLKQVDFDGSFEYSSIITVEFYGSINTDFSVYPNPSSGEFYIGRVKEVSTKVLVKNSLGQTIFIGLPNNGRVDLSNFQKGVYFLFYNNLSTKIIIE